MALLTPTQAKGENFLSGTTEFAQSDDASDPATSNPIEYSALESDALKSFLKMLLNIASNSGARYVENTTSSDIPAATLCYVSGYDETNGAFLVSTATPGHPPTLVTLADLPDTEFGVAYQANVSQANLDTSTASAVGALVYLDPATPGAWTFVVGDYIVGMVLVKNATVGQISWCINGVPTIALPLATSSGGTGGSYATQQAVINALVGAVSAGYFLRGNNTNVVMAQIASSDVPVLKNIVEEVNVKGNISGAVTFNLQDGNVATATSNGDITSMAITNPPAAEKSAVLELILTNGGANAIAYPTGTNWGAAGEPTLQASGINKIIFQTVDGGSTWTATLAF